MKKKMIAGALSLAVLSAAAIPVCADETLIQVTIPTSYQLTIPKETNIGFNAESTNLDGVLKVSGKVLPTQSIQVTVETKALHNSVQNTNLPYTLKCGADTFTGAVWSEEELYAGLAGEGEGKELQLSVAIDKAEWDKAEAGKYEGGIVFTATLK